MFGALRKPNCRATPDGSERPSCQSTREDLVSKQWNRRIRMPESAPRNRSMRWQSVVACSTGGFYFPPDILPRSHFPTPTSARTTKIPSFTRPRMPRPETRPLPESSLDCASVGRDEINRVDPADCWTMAEGAAFAAGTDIVISPPAKQRPRTGNRNLLRTDIDDS